MSSKLLCPSILLAGCLLVQQSSGSRLGSSSAQESDAAAATSAPAALPSTTTLPRAYPVLTIQSWCPEKAGVKSSSAPNCKKTLSRTDFEELVDAINPKMSKAERRDLANNYAQVLVLSQEALRRGLDKNPRVQAALLYSRLNILAHEMSVELYREAAPDSSEQVEKYYANHQSDFTLYKVERIFIPREKQGQTQTLDEAQQGDPPSSVAEMKALAERIQARAAAGESFVALQESAFQQAGIKAHPTVEMEIGRNDLATQQLEVLDLAPGKVSALFSDATGYYIYKMLSKQTRTLDSVREQVEIKMKNQETADRLRKIQKQAQVKVNDAYFDKYDPPPPDPNQPDVDTD